MTDDMIKLGKRAVACKGWRWMHGMSNSSGEVIDCVDVETGKAYCGEWDADITALPDFQDPATLGCLLALVRDAWGCSGMATIQKRGRWEVWKCQKCSGECFDGFGATEAKALVAALEGAP